MVLRARAVAGAVLAWTLLAVTAVLAPSASATVVVTEDEVDLRCSLVRSAPIPIDWYAPDETAGDLKGVAYLQHGLLGDSSDMRDLALRLSHDGYVVAAPTLSSFSTSCGITSQSLLVALGDAFVDGAIEASWQRASGRDEDLPSPTVVAGHATGAAAATFAAMQSDLRDEVAVIVHLDGTESTNGLLHSALSADAGRLDARVPLLQLTAPPSEADDDQRATAVVAAFRPGGSYSPGIDGALVVTGTHCDPVGDYPFNVCGSTPENQRAFFDLTLAGANEATGHPGESIVAVAARLDSFVTLAP